MSDIYCARCEGVLVGAWRRSQLPSNQENNHMDPNANLKEQRKLAKWLLTQIDIHNLMSDEFDFTDEVVRLAELVQALDGWITGGGFLPKDWNKLCRDSS